MSSLMNVHSSRAYIGSGPVVNGDLESCLQEIAGFAGDGEPHLVVTANLDHIIDLHRGTELLTAYEHASLRTIDGAPVLWVYRMLGAKDVHRLTGADLIDDIVGASERFGWTIAITGGKESTLEAAATNLSNKYPHSRVFPVPMPMLDSAEDPKSLSTVQALAELQPDIVFVCLGAPKQESWYLHWEQQLPPAVYVGAGAAVDFAAGTKRRAPRLAQRLGFEWVWRLSQEFTRLAPRYLIKGPRFIGIAAQAFVERITHPAV